MSLSESILQRSTNPYTIRYWSEPWYSRLYMRLLFAASAFLYTGIFLGRFSFPLEAQMMAGAIMAAVVLAFRVVIPEGFDNVRLYFKQISDDAQRELDEGDYSGIPKFMIDDAEALRRRRGTLDESHEEHRQQH